MHEAERDRLIETLFAAAHTHTKRCVNRFVITKNGREETPIGKETCVCSKPQLGEIIDHHFDMYMGAQMRFAESRTIQLEKILDDQGVEKCDTCKDYCLEKDMVYCEGCNATLHEKCAAYAQSGGYYDDDGYAICFNCHKDREKYENQQINDYGDLIGMDVDSLPF